MFQRIAPWVGFYAHRVRVMIFGPCTFHHQMVRLHPFNVNAAIYDRASLAALHAASDRWHVDRRAWFKDEDLDELFEIANAILGPEGYPLLHQS